MLNGFRGAKQAQVRHVGGLEVLREELHSEEISIKVIDERGEGFPGSDSIW